MLNEDWIFSDEARQLLVQVDFQLENGNSLIQVIKQLRKSFSLEQASLLMDLHALRIRGQKKFTRSRELFYQRKQLEQATSEIVGRYKAKRFLGFERVGDLCCGIGGDAIALAEVADLEIVDASALILKMAEKNVAAYGYRCTASCLPAEQFSVDRVHAFHIDPDRRSELTGKPSRSSDLENFSPSRIQLQKLEAVNANFGLKLAPATEMWEGDYEIEFIGHDRECKQQVVWGGQLAQIPGVRASVIQNNGQVETFFVAGKTVCQPELVSRVGRYILDPHSCLLSAKLVGEFALKNGLRVLCQQSCYLSGDVPLDSKLATCFEVQDVLKPKIKLIENYLAEHGIGAIEVKKRGPVDSVFEKLKRLKGRGQNSITLVTSLTPWGVRVIACQRILGQCRE